MVAEAAADDLDVLAEAVPAGPLGAGVEVVRAHMRTMPNTPGVYRMLDRDGDVLYVGKAKALKRRVTNYCFPQKLSNRLRRMVAETARMEVVTTHTEVEALLLEINLIKQLKPRFNISLRDDKSFPYILVRQDHPWAQITKHRGAQNTKGEYFGPFASAGAVNRTLTALQRAFLLRSCSDSVFNSRTRPCLLYQIKRCSGPCVDRIAPEDYAALLDEARAFLNGQSRRIQEEFSRRMQAASAEMAFETAALYRDRIRALSQIQAHQDINVVGMGDADVIAAYEAGGHTCVQIFFFRAGQNYGNRAYYPTHDRNVPTSEVLAAFIGQFYTDKPPPRLILTSELPTEEPLLSEALSLKAGRRVVIRSPRRGSKRKLVEHAALNARDAMQRHLAEGATQRKLLEGVATVFGLDGPPQRIEVYDNSHIAGTHPVGAMIVAGPEGLQKNAYRKFNIRDVAATGSAGPTAAADGTIAPGDDYAMLRQMLTRRFARQLADDPERAGATWPDLVLIDGGAGQLGIACEVMAALGVHQVPLAAIAKGPDRDAGRERFFMPTREPFSLPPNDPVLYFLQRLRDEAHRFAIGSHRTRRSNAISRSALDEIAGIGAARKRALLHHFGSARSVAQAGLADLEAVTGINRTVARKVYDHFHPQG